MGADAVRFGADAEPNDEASENDDIHHFAQFMRGTKVPPPNVPPLGSTARQRYDNGQKQFAAAGCAECHVTEMTTSGGDINFRNNVFQVPNALRNKRIFPFSDFLLHDIGTGDGVVISVVEHYGVPVGWRMLGRQLNALPSKDRLRSMGVDQIVSLSPAAADDLPACANAQANIDPYRASFAKMQCFANFLRTPPLWGIRVRSKLMHDGESVTVEDAISRHKREGDHSRKQFDVLRQQHPSDADDLIFFVLSQ